MTAAAKAVDAAAVWGLQEFQVLSVVWRFVGNCSAYRGRGSFSRVKKCVGFNRVKRCNPNFSVQRRANCNGREMAGGEMRRKGQGRAQSGIELAAIDRFRDFLSSPHKDGEVSFIANSSEASRRCRLLVLVLSTGLPAGCFPGILHCFWSPRGISALPNAQFRRSHEDRDAEGSEIRSCFDEGAL